MDSILSFKSSLTIPLGIDVESPSNNFYKYCRKDDTFPKYIHYFSGVL